jgi:hypothetical protein
MNKKDEAIDSLQIQRNTGHDSDPVKSSGRTQNLLL